MHAPGRVSDSSKKDQTQSFPIGNTSKDCIGIWPFMNGSAEQCFSSAERAEVEAELLVMERIHKAVKIAAAAACGSQAAQMVLAIPKERVQRSKSISSGPDLYCHAPITLFRKLRVGLGAVQPLHLSLVSEFGVSRDLFYSDARDLAAAIIRCLDDVEGVRRDLADVRTREDGCLLLCSSLHMRRQRALGRLHCDACGTFYCTSPLGDPFSSRRS